MADLKAYVDFTVLLDKSGTVPSIVFTDTSAYPSGVASTITGKVDIKQPDAFISYGAYTDVTYIEAALTTNTKALRLDTLKNFQNGTYTITYTVKADGYDDTVVTKAFVLAYDKKKGTITDLMDVFTPSLIVRDSTNYQQAGFSVLTVNREWTAIIDNVLGAEIELTSTLADFDLKYFGSYYDANYNITLKSVFQLQGQINNWVTLKDAVNTNYQTEAHTAPTIKSLIESLANMKLEIEQGTYCSASCGCGIDYSPYEKATAIYNQFTERGLNGQFVTPDRLDKYSDQLQKLFTCGCITRPYIGKVISAYDFTGAGGGSTQETLTFDWQEIQMIVGDPYSSSVSGVNVPADGANIITIPFAVMPKSEIFTYQGVKIKRNPSDDFNFTPTYNTNSTTYEFSESLSGGYSLDLQFSFITSRSPAYVASTTSAPVNSGLQVKTVHVAATGNTIHVSGLTGTLKMVVQNGNVWMPGQVVQDITDITLLDFTSVGGVVAGQDILILYEV